MSKRKTKIFSFLVLSLLITVWAAWYFDQGPVVWETSFDDENFTRVNFVQATPDGGVVIGGSYFIHRDKPVYGPDYSQGHPWAIKLDHAGNLLWDIDFSSLLGFSGDSAALLADGSLAIGCTKRAGVYKHRFTLLTALDARGGHKEIGFYVVKPGYSISQTKVLADGGAMLLGEREAAGKKTPNGWVARLSPQLLPEWSQSFDGDRYGSFDYLHLAPQGSSIVCAVKNLGHEIREHWWLKIDPKGNLLWDRVIKGNQYLRPKYKENRKLLWVQALQRKEMLHTTFSPFYSTKILADGDLLISGRYDNLFYYKRVGFTLLRLNGSNGEIQWGKIYLREGRDEINTINPLTNGLMFYGGAYEPVYPTGSLGLAFWIGDAQGSLYWEKKYSAYRESYDFILRSAATHDGGVVVVGIFDDKRWVAKILPKDDWLKSLLKNKPEIQAVSLPVD